MKEPGFETILNEDWLSANKDNEDVTSTVEACESCDNTPGCDCDNPCYSPDCTSE